MAAILFDCLVRLGKLFHSFIRSSDLSSAKGMEITMTLLRELIKSDFVRPMMLREIFKFLFLTDNNCYCFIHNWTPKEGLLLSSNNPVFFFVSDNGDANQMKSYLHSRKPMSINEAQRTKNVA